MRYTQAEKMEIIRLVEESEWPVKRTLDELGIPRSTFYRWYDRYLTEGYVGLADRKPGPQQFWNQIPEKVRQHVGVAGGCLGTTRPIATPISVADHR